MASRAELAALIVRVEGATGSDRELDSDIAEVLGQVPEHFERQRQYAPGTFFFKWHPDRPDVHSNIPWFAPGYSSSINAAVALIDRVLPKATHYGFDVSPTSVEAFVSRNNVANGHWYYGDGEHKTPALALCLALLRALHTQATE